MSGIIESLTGSERLWLLTFWETRDLVTAENRCPTPLVIPDSRRRWLWGRPRPETVACVLSVRHLDHDTPHATASGRLAPILVHQATIREAAYWATIPLPEEE